ncbi:MAG: cation:proton antiporter [Hyphomicrobiaceae bacterium]
MAATINIPVYSDALVVLGTAGIVVPIVQRLGISPVLGYLAAGALLGPLGLGSFIAQAPFLYWLTVVDAKNVSGIADLGVVFLLFLVGLELSFERLMAMRRLVFGLGGLQILVSTAAIASIAALAGQTAAVAIMLGALLALSSTAVVLQILSEQGRMMSSTGRASFAVLLAQDLAVIPILMFVSILGANTGATIAASIGTALLQALAALAIIAVVGRIVLRPLLRLVAATRSNDLFIAVILFVIVATGVIAALAGLSMALGAFVAGLLLSETEYRKAIEATIEPFKGLLLGLFFFTIGMSIDAREVIREPVLLLGSVVGLVLLKALILVAVARLYRLNWPVAVEIGLLLGPGGEFAFVGIGLALALGLVPPPVASFTLAVTSLGMALIPLNAIVARRLAPLLQAPKAVEPELLLQPAQQQRHAIVIGYGRVGKLVCSLLREHGVPFTAVDNDPNAVARDRRAGHAVYFGDATQPAFLDACGIKDAAGVIVTLNRASIVDEVVGEVRHLRPDVLIVARARDGVHAQHLYGIGVTDAVPETIEASLQLSEAALVGLGVPTGPVIASLHEHRETVRKDLQAAARLAVRSRSGPQSGKV